MQGDKIQAFVKGHLQKQFNPQLQEDDVVILSYFGVGENKDEYPVVKSDYKVTFYRGTTVERGHGWQGREYGFNLVPFKDILKGETKGRLSVG